MLDTAQNIYLIILWVVLSTSFLIVLNHLWAPARRRTHNDIIGWQISILGTIYAVMIGFMLYAVWANFQTAEANVDNEANALGNLYRSANGLPQAQRELVQKLSTQYAILVMRQEWPAMQQLRPAQAGQATKLQLWDVLTHTPIETRLQQVSLQESMQELNSLSQYRRVRRLEARTKMPNVLWAVLIVGGMITIASCCLIGSENFVLHFALIFALSFLISMALVAIGDLDQPFQGSVHVSATPFARVLTADGIPTPDCN